MSDYDPADFGDELRLTIGLEQKNGKPKKYAPGSKQFKSSSHGPITDDQFAANKDKAIAMAAEMGIEHPHTGQLFEKSSYRYYVVGVQIDAVMLAVRARNGDLHKFEPDDAHAILATLDEDNKAVL